MIPIGKRDRDRGLRLIQGGLFYKTKWDSLRIVASHEDTPPFPVEGIALEEDTFLVLSAEPVIHEVHEHPVRLMTRLIETRPEVPGRVLVKGRRPYRFLAIIHDLNQEPTWKEAWVSSALQGIFQEAEKRRLQSIALPMLGTKHGTLEKHRFILLLRNAIDPSALRYLKRIWLIVPEGTARHMIETLKSEFEGETPC